MTTPAVIRMPVDMYVIRHKGAVNRFIVSDDGLLAACTDYGDYSTRFECPGKPMKEFLVSIRPDYLLGRIARPDWLNWEVTQRNLRTAVDQARYEGVIEEFACDQLIDALTHRFGSQTTAVELHNWMQECPDVFDTYSRETATVLDFSPSARVFVAELWPLFVATLRDELSGKAKGA